MASKNDIVKSIIPECYVESNGLFILDTDKTMVDDEKSIDETKEAHAKEVSGMSDSKLFQSILDWAESMEEEDSYYDTFDMWCYDYEVDEFRKRIGLENG